MADASIGYNTRLSSGETFNTVCLLATVAGINLNTAAVTAAYVAPAGHAVVITGFIVEYTAVTVLTIAPTVRVGVPAANTSYIAASALTGLTAVGDYVDLGTLTAFEIHNLLGAGATLNFEVTVGATATTLTGRIHVLGFII